MTLKEGLAGELGAPAENSLTFSRVLEQKGVSGATLCVGVRCRPLTRPERSKGMRSISRIIEDRVVVVMDPNEDMYNTAMRRDKRMRLVQGVPECRERQYVFDRAFDGDADNREVYRHMVHGIVPGVLRGFNATVFAYGATGSGKTYTMVGTEEDPGLMVLALRDIFRYIGDDPDHKWNVTCSYLEVYNEVIYDLLVPDSDGLELREDPEEGPKVTGLSRVRVASAEEIYGLLQEGNRRRKTEPTEVNAVSSRSHAVLEIEVQRSEVHRYQRTVTTARLSLVDLAGSERAAETKNRGQQLKDGANINRSLLALANCINSLGKRQRKGLVFVPWRDSKLTRLLKDGLCGNSRTVMVATVSSADGQYQHSVNTLKYANRAKEIKTHVRRNESSVEAHIGEYQRLIDELREQNADLRRQLAAPASAPTSAPVAAAAPGASPGKWARGPEEAAAAQRHRAWSQTAVASLRGSERECRVHREAVLEVEDLCLKCQQEVDELTREVEACVEAGIPAAHPAMAALKARRAAAERALRDGEGMRARLDEQLRRADAAAAQAAASLGSSGEGCAAAAALPGALRASGHAGVALTLLDLYRGLFYEQQHVIANLWRAIELSGASRHSALLDLCSTGLVPFGPAALGDPETSRHAWAPPVLDDAVPPEILAAIGGRVDRYLSGAHAEERYMQLRSRVRDLAVRLVGDANETDAGPGSHPPLEVLSMGSGDEGSRQTTPARPPRDPRAVSGGPRRGLPRGRRGGGSPAMARPSGGASGAGPPHSSSVPAGMEIGTAAGVMPPPGSGIPRAGDASYVRSPTGGAFPSRLVLPSASTAERAPAHPGGHALPGHGGAGLVLHSNGRARQARLQALRQPSVRGASDGMGGAGVVGTAVPWSAGRGGAAPAPPSRAQPQPQDKKDRLGDLRQRLASARTHPDSDSEGLRHAASPHRAAAPLAPAPVSPSCSSPSGPASSPPTTDRSRGPSPDLDPGHAPGRAENGEEGRGQGGASLAPNPRHPSSSRTAENDREVTGSPDDGNGREPRPSSGNAATPEKDSEAGSGLRLEASLPASASGTGDDDGHDGAGVGLVRSSQSQEDPPGGGRRVGRLRRWLSRIASSSAS